MPPGVLELTLFCWLGYSLAHLAYYIDILNTIAAFAVFWEQIQSKPYYEKELTTRFANDNTGIPDITR